MKGKKECFYAVFALGILLIASAYAVDFTVTSKPVAKTIINTNNKPLIFDFTIKNNGPASYLEIYTFEKFKIVPSNFTLDAGEQKVIEASFYPIGSMKENEGYVTVPYYIRDMSKLNEAPYNGEIVVKLVSFKNAFDVGGENINLDSNSVKVYFYNREDITYDSINAVFSSAFFEDSTQTISLNPYERKEIVVPLNKDKLKKLVAGSYSVRATTTIDGKTENLQGFIKILEKSGLTVSESKSGLIVRKYTIEKANEGNVPTVAEVTMNKNIVSRLFSTFSVEPNRVETKGFFVYYTWQKELQPDEKLKVVATTNLIFPFVLIIFIVIIVWMVNAYIKQNLVIKKSVGFVKTKSDDFALKIVLRVKARKFMEKVVIYDRLPGIAKLYEKFDSAPTHVDRERGKMQWNIGRLAEGEERVFSYIIYSKIKIVGKFELPPAAGVYEIQGKFNETKSNSAFFINEPRMTRERD